MALQAETAGVESPAARQAAEGDFGPLAESLVVRPARAKGKPFGLAAAAHMRLSRPALA
jgi:hypothetical protein